jgi:hypothetical protein
VLDRARFGELSRTMLAFFDADARLAPVMGSVDRARYALDP